MTDKPILIPGPDHPITIEAHSGRVVVTVAGRIVAEDGAVAWKRKRPSRQQGNRQRRERPTNEDHPFAKLRPLSGM